MSRRLRASGQGPLRPQIRQSRSVDQHPLIDVRFGIRKALAPVRAGCTKASRDSRGWGRRRSIGSIRGQRANRATTAEIRSGARGQWRRRSPAARGCRALGRAGSAFRGKRGYSVVGLGLAPDTSGSIVSSRLRAETIRYPCARRRRTPDRKVRSYGISTAPGRNSRFSQLGTQIPMTNLFVRDRLTHSPHYSADGRRGGKISI